MHTLSPAEDGRVVFHCERGAIAVFGLFAAILMAASIYYFAGLADGILRVERAQDAADAMAFSSAAMRARGMNALALINLVSSALLSVAAALRVLEVLSTVGVTVLALTGQLVQPQARLSVADFEALRQEVRTSGAYVNAAERARVGLGTLEQVAQVLRITVPWSADKHMIDHAVSHYLPEMSFGTAMPAFPSLPVHMEGGVSLCERVDANARQAALGVVTALLPPSLTPPPRALLPTYDRNTVLDIMQRALDQLGVIPGYACQTGQSAPATLDLGPLPATLMPAYPELAESHACTTYATGPDGLVGTADDPARYDPNRHRALCEAAWSREWESWPAEQNFATQVALGTRLDNGECRNGAPIGGGSSPNPSITTAVACGQGSAWEERIRAARAQCTPGGNQARFIDPTGAFSGLCNGSRCNSLASSFGFIEATVERTYHYTGAAWEEMPELRREVVPASSVFITDGRLPCGLPNATFAPTWNAAPYDARGYPAPICREARPTAPPLCPLTDGPCPPLQPRAGALYTQVAREALEVLFCGATTDLNIQVPVSSNGRGLGEITTRIVALDANVMLGDAEFQARAAALWPVDRLLTFGPNDPRREPKGPLIASLVQPTDDVARGNWGSMFADAVQAEGVATAQAEMFYTVADTKNTPLPTLQRLQRDPAERARWLWNERWSARLTGLHDLTDPEWRRLVTAFSDPELQRVLFQPQIRTANITTMALHECGEAALRNGQPSNPCDWLSWQWTDLMALSTH